MNRYAFQMHDVRKSYPEFALDIPEFSLERGYILGLVGQNGAGKSTLIKTLINLIYPNSGIIEVLGRRQPSDEIEIKRRIGYVSETPEFYEGVTVDWMIRLVRQFYPTWDNTLCASYLERFCLSPRKKVKDLSKGMKVKLALLLALSRRPELLILDEPTSGIDPVIRRELLEEITAVIQDERRTVIFSSHISQDVEQIADYVAILDNGSIEEYQDKESLLERYRQLSGTYMGNPEVLKAVLQGCRIAGNCFVGVTDRYDTRLLSELTRIGVTNIRVSTLGIDGILLHVTGREPVKCGI